MSIFKFFHTLLILPEGYYFSAFDPPSPKNLPNIKEQRAATEQRPGTD